MSFIAGVYRRTGNPIAMTEVKRDLEAAIAGLANDVLRFDDGRLAIWKVAGHAFGDPGFSVEENGAIVVAGSPLAAGSSAQAQRLDGLAGTEARTGSPDGWLRTCDGAFALCLYDAGSGRLTVATDRLGVRPVYLHVTDELVVFANALWPLEKVNRIPRRISMRAVLEQVAFGYPLGTRTVYADVSRLHAGRLIEVTPHRVSERSYWRWSEVRESDSDHAIVVQQAYEHFVRAVRRRFDATPSTFAFLSGGLDSRCVVATLKEAGLNPVTFTFADVRTKDYVFSAEIARRMGLSRSESPLPAGSPAWSGLMAEQLRAGGYVGADGPGAVWSGDGGSVGTGCVYLTEEIVADMRAGRASDACKRFIAGQEIHLPKAVFARSMMHRVSGALIEGMMEELAKLEDVSAGRRFHTFLMVNDQRSHLLAHHEHILTHGVEMLTPFLDSSFIESVMAVSVDRCLRHRFYHEWLQQFPAVVREVPWQTYPGHLPCPVAWEGETLGQWDDSYHEERHRTQWLKAVAEGFKASVAPDLPHVIRRSMLGAATLATASGLRDYAYAIRTVTRLRELCRNAEDVITDI